MSEKDTYGRLTYLLAFCIMFGGVVGLFFEKMTYVTIFNLCLQITSFVLILLFIQKKKLGFRRENVVVKFFLFWSLIVLIHSFIIAEKYEQWRYIFTVYVPFLLLPLVSILGSKMSIAIPLMKGLLFSGLGLSLLFWIYEIGNASGMNDYTHFVSVIYAYLLLREYLRTSLYIFIILVTISSIIYDIDVRTNLFSISFIIIVFVGRLLLKQPIFIAMLKVLRRALILMPILFFVLGVVKIFNIFQFFDTLKNPIQLTYADKTTSLNKDTRTNVYSDALVALADDGKFIWGISAAGLHKTSLSEIYHDTLRSGRMGSEVGILVYFLRGGIIFCILTFFLYSKSSYMAIYKSNNGFIKLLGVYVAFRWFLLFIEAQPFFNGVNVLTFLLIGLCLNPSIRRLGDDDVSNIIKINFYQ